MWQKYAFMFLPFNVITRINIKIALTNLKIITKVKDYRKLLNDTAIKQFEQAMDADNMYQLISSIDLKHPQKNEFQRKLILID